MSGKPNTGPRHRTPAQWLEHSFPIVRRRLLAYAHRLAGALPPALDATPVDGEDLFEEAVLRVLRDPRFSRPMDLDELCRILAGTCRYVASEARRAHRRWLDGPGTG